MPKVCEYYFAPQSPFAYLGHARFVALAKQYGVQIDLKPMRHGQDFQRLGRFAAGQARAAATGISPAGVAALERISWPCR